jgi:hypothetical protein
MKTRLIAISGKFGTGKDTLVLALEKYLQEKEIEFIHCKFAKALKDSAAIILGMKVEDMYTDEGKSKYIPTLDMTVGRFQQIYGTEMRKHIHNDIWVFPVINTYLDNVGKVILISDCRFPNEADTIKEYGGIIIRLERDSSKINTNGRDPYHISETALDDYGDFDLVIENNGTKEEMIDKAFAYLSV